MRYRFAREGVKTIGSKAFFEPESIKWPVDGVIPVFWENNFSDATKLLGSASDLRREEDGWVTADIAWNLKGEEVEGQVNKEVWLTVFVNHILEKESTDIAGKDWRIIQSCTLRGIYTSALEDPWVEEGRKFYCPECAQGKVGNCAGQTVHPVTDELVACASTQDFEV